MGDPPVDAPKDNKQDEDVGVLVTQMGHPCKKRIEPGSGKRLNCNEDIGVRHLRSPAPAPAD